MKESVVALTSGGLDSTVLTYSLIAIGYSPETIAFNYGQKHLREIYYARRTATRLGLRFDMIDIVPVGRLLEGSALTDSSVPVPEGEYDEETMAVTVVPNRNAIFLNIAAGVAISRGISKIALAVHSGDHAIYPDCGAEFLNAAYNSIRVGTGKALDILSPFLWLSKAAIVSIGVGLNVPFELTWSCYKGGTNHCGVCGTCRERREAFRLAGVLDPTRYEV